MKIHLFLQIGVKLVALPEDPQFFENPDDGCHGCSGMFWLTRPATRDRWPRSSARTAIAPRPIVSVRLRSACSSGPAVSFPFSSTPPSPSLAAAAAAGRDTATLLPR